MNMLLWIKLILCRLFVKNVKYRHCGMWGTYNIETKKSTIGGKTYTQTSKFTSGDTTLVNTEWVTDETVGNIWDIKTIWSHIKHLIKNIV